MAVHDRQVVIVVLGRHLSGGVRAERADPVVKGGRVIHELCLVEVLVQVLHDLVPDLDAHADVHGAGRRLDAKLLALAVEPVGAVTSDSQDDLRRSKGLRLLCADACDLPILNQDLLHRIIKEHVDTGLCQVGLHLLIDLVADLGAEVPDRTLDEL